MKRNFYSQRRAKWAYFNREGEAAFSRRVMAKAAEIERLCKSRQNGKEEVR